MGTRRIVRTYMTRSPLTVPRTTTMARAMKLLDEHGFRHLPIVDEAGKLIGLLSERELKIVENMRVVDAGMACVEDFILGPPYSVSPETPLAEVTRTMAEKKYGSAVVVEGDTVVGLFTTVDALRALTAMLDEVEGG
ncbi:CBS domain-containing protein [Polyangium spumosum]|uniref:CBS domain-containing protein n=1 Tax=Polyangium spumosum TaxID=889282 RepID=A0A6N7Q0A7_9BACT|nr:CBS domain-containing protein [Polyangium spumosum]MRG97237.1 CBS domain-containing protein [Polyangium spumosum]